MQPASHSSHDRLRVCMWRPLFEANAVQSTHADHTNSGLISARCNVQLSQTCRALRLTCDPQGRLKGNCQVFANHTQPLWLIC
eukprot:364304-Chlamydomonas_euryale.AAC.8